MALDMSAFSPGSLAARLLAVLHQSRVTRHRFGRGAAVFRQGDPATAMFLVETGRVRLVRVLADGTSLFCMSRRRAKVSPKPPCRRRTITAMP